MERAEGEGEGGLVVMPPPDDPILASSLGSEWVRDNGAPEILLFGLYLGGSLNGTEKIKRNILEHFFHKTKDNSS